MALNRYQHRHVQPYGDGGGNIRGINLADVEYGANMAGHLADYALGRGDFAPLPPAKRFQRDNVDYMEADSTNNQINNGNSGYSFNTMAMSGTGGNSGGFRGKTTGNTQDDLSYEKYYHEILYGHSKKLRNCLQYWGMSIYARKDPVTQNKFPYHKYGSNTRSINGMVWVKSSDIFANAINPFQPYGPNQTCPDHSESIYSNALNFYLRDFVDNKLLNEDATQGLFTRWNKFTLKSFTIHITPTSHHESLSSNGRWILHSAANNNEWTTSREKETWKRSLGYQGDTVQKRQHYWFFRDEFGSFVNKEGNIPLTPPDAAPGASEDKMKRESYAIKNLDRNLCKVADGESFSFTREIKPIGSYYFTKDTIKNNLSKNIANIVAALEGQIDGDGSIIKKLPEFFNILYCPDTCEMEWVGECNFGAGTEDIGYLVLPKLNTNLLIKTTAKWEAFDYNYQGDTQPAFYSDPLESALFDYQMEKTITAAQLNRGIL